MKRRFLSINFHQETVERFKGFCAKLGGSYTETLEHMMDFFDTYQLSPMEDFGPNMRGLEATIKKRINALVAIIKDIENNQTKPTTAMLQLLFEKTPAKQKQPRLVEVKKGCKVSKDPFFTTSLEAIELRKEKNTLQRDLKETKQQFDDILFSKIRIVKSSFGKTKIQLDMSIEELESLRETMKTR
ncbi:BfmA/BtgA family mobilization protein [Yeosuana marina]|uniref:BfmA/BtgA family mobilization protein n=1 Tax=Yeosuana marina TaxID=1565536 RepID=UPI0030EE8CDC|tara:strand:- start:4027 stop:4584 length:558 start_codon:yes stop_codon:yes gene_type:complete